MLEIFSTQSSKGEQINWISTWPQWHHEMILRTPSKANVSAAAKIVTFSSRLATSIIFTKSSAAKTLSSMADGGVPIRTIYKWIILPQDAHVDSPKPNSPVSSYFAKATRSSRSVDIPMFEIESVFDSMYAFRAFFKVILGASFQYKAAFHGLHDYLVGSSFHSKNRHHTSFLVHAPPIDCSVLSDHVELNQTCKIDRACSIRSSISMKATLPFQVD